MGNDEKTNESKFSLVNIYVDLKELSKPAAKLVDAVKGAIGLAYEPNHTVRMAKAQVKSALVQEEGKGELALAKGRAAHRLLEQESRRQQNIEKITKTAIDILPDETNDNQVDEDWVYQFYESCHDVGNEEMQTLWAKILAGEVATPGSYSRQTLQVIKQLSIEDAHSFTKIISTVWRFEHVFFTAVIPSPDFKSIKNLDITFAELSHLQDLGLVGHNLNLGIDNIDKLVAEYHGHIFELSVNPKRSEQTLTLKLGQYSLTLPGRELAIIAGGDDDEKYMQSILGWWEKQGFVSNRKLNPT